MLARNEVALVGESDALYPVGDGSFAFARTVSRLHEMQSYDYMHAPHLT